MKNLSKGIEFSKRQFNEIVTEMILNEKIELKEIIETSLLGLMKMERKIFLDNDQDNNKGNGYRGIRASFDNSILELSVPPRLRRAGR